MTLPSDEQVEEFLGEVKQSIRWKICCGCDALVATVHPLCPNCHTYRFDGSREAVQAVLDEMMEATGTNPQILADKFIDHFIEGLGVPWLHQPPVDGEDSSGS
jgi:hypothetical protein